MTDQLDIPPGSNLIYHVTTKCEWDHALKTGFYDRSTRGKSFGEVGFIHASLRNQIEQVAKFVYSHTDDELVVLVLNLENLEDSGYLVRFEDGGNGQLYPHIYSPISVDLVIDTRDGAFDNRGNFLFAG